MIAPKLRRLHETITPESQALLGMAAWESVRYKPSFRGLLRWEEYRGSYLYSKGRSAWTVYPLWFMRILALYIPAILLFVKWASSKNISPTRDALHWEEYPLLLILGVGVLLTILTLRTVGSIAKESRVDAE